MRWFFIMTNGRPYFLAFRHFDKAMKRLEQRDHRHRYDRFIKN